MKGKFQTCQLSCLKKQPIRSDQGSDDVLISLAQSWLTRAIHPIVCRPDMTIADGNRRVAGLELLGVKEVEVFVTTEELTDAQMVEIALLTAVHRKGLTDYERVQAVKRLAAAYSNWSRKELANHLNMDSSVITKMLATGLIPVVDEAFQAGRISINDRYRISQEPPEKQHAMLEDRFKTTREEWAAKTRKARSTAPAVRASRIKVPLVSGATVTVAGDEVSMEEALEAVQEAAKQLKAAIAKGITAKSAMGYWKDLAAAG